MKKTALIIVSFFSILINVEAQTLRAFYPFNGNANDAVGVLNGTVNGATPTTDRFGNADKAFSFDGINDNITYNAPWTNLTNNFSITVWITRNTTFATILTNGQNSFPAASPFNGYSIKCANIAVGDINGVASFVGNTNIPLNTWTFIALIRDNGVSKLYVNGVLQTSTITATPFIPTTSAIIGSLNSAVDFWNGKIDDVKIYNGVVSVAQLLQEYNEFACNIPAPSVSTSGPVNFCAGGNVTLTSNATTGNLWSNGATTQSITVNSSGNYSLTVTDVNGCTATSDLINVIVNPLPARAVITTNGPTSFCQGGNVILSSSFATGNLWSTGETTQSITVSSSGNYRVRHTDANGCANLQSLPVIVTANPLPEAPTISASGPLSFCEGSSVTLTSNTATGYLWNTGETSQSITVNNASNFSVQVADINGCISANSSEVNTIIKPLPIVDIINNSGNTELTCTNNFISLTATGNDISSYVWTRNNSVISVAINPQFNLPGNYVLTGTGSNGCTNTDAIVITENRPAPVAPVRLLAPTNLCPYIGTNTPLVFSVHPNPQVITFGWTVPNGMSILSGQGTEAITVILNNNFNPTLSSNAIRVNSNSFCGISPTLTISLQAQSAPSTPSTISASTTNVCGSIGTNIPITYKINPVNGASSYIWDADLNTTTITHPNGPGKLDTIVSVTFTNQFATSPITVRALNNCGSSAGRSFNITRNNPSKPKIFGPSNACAFMAPNGNYAMYYVPAEPLVSRYEWTITYLTNTPDGQPGAGIEYNPLFPQIPFGNDTLSIKYPQYLAKAEILVRQFNGHCASPVSGILNVNILKPASPGGIDIINESPCPQRTYRYSIATIPAQATSLLWTIPSNGVILSGQGTTSILVSYPLFAINGNVSVRAVNNCGSSTTRSVSVKLPFCLLLKNGQAARNTVSTSQESASELQVNISPNPTSSDFKMQINSSSKNPVAARILDLQGRELKKIIVNPVDTRTLGGDLTPGTYLIEVTQGQERIIKKLIKL